MGWGGLMAFWTLNIVDKNCTSRVLRVIRVLRVFRGLLVSLVSFVLLEPLVLLLSSVLLDLLNIWKRVNHRLTDLQTTWNQEMLSASKKAFDCALNTSLSPYFGRLPKGPYPLTFYKTHVKRFPCALLSTRPSLPSSAY